MVAPSLVSPGFRFPAFHAEREVPSRASGLPVGARSCSKSPVEDRELSGLVAVMVTMRY
jgi:hypothetical protein